MSKLRIGSWPNPAIGSAGRSATMGPSNNGNGHESEREGDLLLAPAETKPKRPPFYKVVMLNDDYTPMDFVVHVLQTVFHKNHDDAVSVMLAVHQKGAGVCGIFTRDVAETKVDLVVQYARMNDYPLQCVMEQE